MKRNDPKSRKHTVNPAANSQRALAEAIAATQKALESSRRIVQQLERADEKTEKDAIQASRAALGESIAILRESVAPFFVPPSTSPFPVDGAPGAEASTGDPPLTSFETEMRNRIAQDMEHIQRRQQAVNQIFENAARVFRQKAKPKHEP